MDLTTKKECLGFFLEDTLGTVHNGPVEHKANGPKEKGIERRNLMNRQELFGTAIHSHETQLDTSYLPFIKSRRSGFCDVNLPRFFSGWPYFILVLATLLMGSAKVSSQGFTSQENQWAPIQHIIASVEDFPKGKTSYFGKTGEYEEKNWCEVDSTPKRGLASANPSTPMWCSRETNHRNTIN